MAENFIYSGETLPISEGSLKEQIDNLTGYVEKLTEQLRYSLAYIDESNFGAGVKFSNMQAGKIDADRISAGNISAQSINAQNMAINGDSVVTESRVKSIVVELLTGSAPEQGGVDGNAT